MPPHRLCCRFRRPAPALSRDKRRAPAHQLCIAVTPASVTGRKPETKTAIGGDLQMTTAIRSTLVRCCLLLGVIGFTLSLSAVGHVATAQQSEDLWKAVQDRGTLRVAAALAPPHV